MESVLESHGTRGSSALERSIVRIVPGNDRDTVVGGGGRSSAQRERDAKDAQRLAKLKQTSQTGEPLIKVSPTPKRAGRRPLEVTHENSGVSQGSSAVSRVTDEHFEDDHETSRASAFDASRPAGLTALRDVPRGLDDSLKRLSAHAAPLAEREREREMRAFHN